MSIFPGWNYCAFCSTNLDEEQIQQRETATGRPEADLLCPECAAPIGVSWTACAACGIRIEVDVGGDGRRKVFKLVRADIVDTTPPPARPARSGGSARRPTPAKRALRPAKGSRRRA